MLYDIEIEIAGDPQANQKFQEIELGKQWDQWPWLLWAMPILEHPEFERMEWVVGLTHVTIRLSAVRP